MQHVPARAIGCIASGFGIGLSRASTSGTDATRPTTPVPSAFLCEMTRYAEGTPARLLGSMPIGGRVVSAKRRRSRFANSGSSGTHIVNAASAFVSSAEGGGYSGFRRGTVGMAPTSRVPGFGPRLGIGSAGSSSATLGIDRTGVTQPHPALASLFRVGLSRVGFWSGRTVNLVSEVLK
jgi:hypothetical protein